MSKKPFNQSSLAPNVLSPQELKRQLQEAQLAHVARTATEGPSATIEFDPDTYKPLHDLLLVEILEDKPKDDPASKIIRPDIAGKAVKDRAKATLVVRAVGPGYFSDYGFFHEQKISVGQIILVNPNGGQPLPEREDKREFLTCRQNEVMAVLGHIDDNKEQSIVTE